MRPARRINEVRIYDASGNELTKTNISTSYKWTYSYSPAGQMTSSVETDPGNSVVATVDYKYDALGNRTEVDSTVGLTTTVTRYAYDMSNPAKAGALGTSGTDIWAVLNGSSSLTSRQLQGDQIDQHLAWVTSGGSQFWYLTDHLGSTRDVVDTNGTLKDSVAFDAYGNILAGELDSTYRGLYSWTGRELDAETGLQYNRARYYDASTGRWISQDPMGFDAGDGNLYRYVENSPEATEDPTGFFSWTLGGGKLTLNVTASMVFWDAPKEAAKRKWTKAREGAFSTGLVAAVNGYFSGSPYTIYPNDAVITGVFGPAGKCTVKSESPGGGTIVKPAPSLTIVAKGVKADYSIRVQSNPPPAPIIISKANVGGPNGMFDEADLTPVTRVRKGVPYTQIPAVHEFGHLLGLEHPGKQKTPDEYSKDGKALMGWGMEYRPAYYKKWVAEMDKREPDFAAHTINDWANVP